MFLSFKELFVSFVMLSLFPLYAMDQGDLIEEEIEINVENNDHVLKGTLVLPETEELLPAFVLLSGSGRMSQEEKNEPFQLLSKTLAHAGFAALSYDKRGCGESSGDFRSATTYDLADDAETVFEFLRNHRKIDETRVGLFGHSEGGLIAAMIAARNRNVSRLMLFAPPGKSMLALWQQRQELIFERMLEKEIITENQADLMKHGMERLQDLMDSSSELREEDLFREAKNSLMQLAGEHGSDDVNPKDFVFGMLDDYRTIHSFTWSIAMMQIDPQEYFQKVTVPVLLVNGKEDLLVPHHINVPLVSTTLFRGGNENLQVVEPEGIGHFYVREEELFMSGRQAVTIDDDLLSIFLEWLSE